MTTIVVQPQAPHQPALSSERWLPCPGFENSYEVSDHGRVRRSKPGKGTWVGTLLKPHPKHRGYLQVILSLGKRGSVAWRQIHRLVATAFIRPPLDGEEVNHKDANPTNNHVDNLEWVTHEGNIAHAIRTGLIPIVQLPPEAIEDIRTSLRSHEELAAIYGVSKGTVYNFRKGLRG